MTHFLRCLNSKGGISLPFHGATRGCITRNIWNGSEMPPLEFRQRRKCVILDMLAEMLKKIALGLIDSYIQTQPKQQGTPIMAEKPTYTDQQLELYLDRIGSLYVIVILMTNIGLPTFSRTWLLPRRQFIVLGYIRIYHN
jgi:hypothetical protein